MFGVACGLGLLLNLSDVAKESTPIAYRILVKRCHLLKSIDIIFNYAVLTLIDIFGCAFVN